MVEVIVEAMVEAETVVVVMETEMEVGEMTSQTTKTRTQCLL